MDDARWQEWVSGLTQGDDAVVREFWDRYGPMLQRVAANHMGDRLRLRAGPEDVVQSVCRTFFRRARAGQFQFDDGDALWRLMCALTLTKVRELARHHRRGKRSFDREIGSDAEGGGPMDSVADAGAAPDDAALFADEFDRLLGSLDEEERALVDLKLQDLTHDQAAERLGVSERTVRRLFQRVQAKLSKSLAAAPSE